MRLDRPFVQLPLRVDAARLADELAQIDESAWRDHPEGAPGNTQRTGRHRGLRASAHRPLHRLIPTAPA